MSKSTSCLRVFDHIENPKQTERQRQRKRQVKQKLVFLIINNFFRPFKLPMLSNISPKFWVSRNAVTHDL